MLGHEEASGNDKIDKLATVAFGRPQGSKCGHEMIRFNEGRNPANNFSLPLSKSEKKEQKYVCLISAILGEKKSGKYGGTKASRNAK